MRQENISGHELLQPGSDENARASKHSLSVVLSAYNEEQVIAGTVSDLLDTLSAWRVDAEEPSLVVRHNYSDVVFHILRAYGTSGFLDPVEEPVPNDWYDALPGRSCLIAEHPTIPLRLHPMSKRELATRKTMLTIPERMQGTAPPWRVNG